MPTIGPHILYPILRECAITSHDDRITLFSIRTFDYIHNVQPSFTYYHIRYACVIWLIFICGHLCEQSLINTHVQKRLD